MGEYAIRKSDGQEIKIGTCESMYYLRLEDKDKVSPLPSSGFGYYWRLPYPDEDNILPGDYKDYNRGERLWKYDETPKGVTYPFNDTINFKAPNAIKDPGTIQLKHPCGLLINMPCYHGERLPDNPPNGKVFWNGKSWFYELIFLRTEGSKVHPVIRCKHCNNIWRCEWDEILPYIHGKLKERLKKYKF